MSKPRRFLRKPNRLLSTAALLVIVLPATTTTATPAVAVAAARAAQAPPAPGAARAAGARADAPITDPIPDRPIDSGLALNLTEYAAFPKSEPFPAPTDPRLMRQARINYIGELPDGSDRKYVPDLNGNLYLVRDGSPPQVYLDVRSHFPDFWSGGGIGSGFGFVAFHPRFAENGKFYTVHTEGFNAPATKTPDLTPEPNTVAHSVITEWTATDPRADTFSGAGREVLRIGFSSFTHTIQQIDFNPGSRPGDPDYGLLYLAVGDGGIGVSTTVPQDLGMPHGKILRIDPLGSNSANGKYGVPATNPFVQRPGAVGEIYAYGMRDPHRFSWDTGTGKMYLGHIGEHAIEAVYEIGPGSNVGWSEREGPFVFNKADRCYLYPLPADDATYGYDYPVAAYDHDPPAGWPCTSDSGHAISGGFVYHGSKVPGLRGKYVFADLVDGRLFYTNVNEMRPGSKLATIYQFQLLDQGGKRVTMTDLAGDPRIDLRVGTDRSGELYLLAKANGKIWKITGTRRVPVSPDVQPSLLPNLVGFYDFEHPFASQHDMELDQGRAHGFVKLVNGGVSMRVPDGAYPGSSHSMQTRQINPAAAGNDDWKAGRYSATGEPSLHAFSDVAGTTVMGWFKMTGENPGLNSNTADPNDRYDAIGLAGLLSGDSDGHAVRALLEVINVNGTLRLVALGRRIDGGASQTFAADGDWQQLLPTDQWVFLAATFDFDRGTMALYRNGERLRGSYTVAGDPWGLSGPGPHHTSATDPRGIKLGGSFPQNSQEGNPCDCRMDNVMFLDRVVSPGEVRQQYQRVAARP
jgi:hypothetical protein